MNASLKKLKRHYADALHEYLAHEQEAALERAFELGRQAVGCGLGVLEMATIHQDSVAKVLRPTPGSMGRSQCLRAAEAFFLEALSPFEVTHRGFREANLKLQHLIATLEKRNLQLAEMNRELTGEIGERKRT